MKKILSIALLCAMVAGTLAPCFTAKAEENWYIDGTVLHIKDTCMGKWQKDGITEIVADKVVTPEILKFENYPSLKKVDFTNIDLSKLTSMEDLFANCPSLEEVDLSGKDASKVTTMKNAFKGCESLKSLTLENLKTDSLEDMEGAFENCKTSDGFNVKGINTSKVTNMSRAFYNCCSMGHTSNCLDLTSFDTRNVTNMRSMFENCMAQEIDLSNFDVSRVTDFSNMFKNAQNVYTIYASKDFTIDLGYEPTYIKSDGMFEENYCLTGRQADFDKNDLNTWKENETQFGKYGNKGISFAKINHNGGDGYFTYKEDPDLIKRYEVEVINGTVVGGRTEFEEDEEVTVKANDDDVNNVFKGWDIKGAAKGIIEIDTNERTVVFRMPANKVKAIANFDKVKHKITYDLNGKQGKTPEQEPLECGETFNISTNITRDSFKGWSDGEKIYQPGDTCTVFESDITLKAIWEEPEAVIEENGNVIAKGTFEEMLANATEIDTVRLVKDTQINTPNTSAAFLDLSGHILKADKVAFDYTQVIDTSNDSTGTLICDDTKFVKSNYIPMYAKDNFSFGDEKVTKGWHFYRIKFATAFGGYFNPKKVSEKQPDLLSYDDDDHGGVRMAYTFKGSNKKALIILANEDITEAGLKLTIAPFMGVPNKGSLEMPDDEAAYKDNPTMTVGNEVLKAQNVKYYTEAYNKTHPPLLAKRGTALRESIKAVAKNLLTNQEVDCGSVILYGTTPDTRIWATYARFKLETKDFIIYEKEIQHVDKGLR